MAHEFIYRINLTMSKLKLTSTVRHAIWLANNKKCVYTNEPIEYANMDVDHIIPEAFLDNEDEFESLKNEYGLDLDFKINGFKNLVPCKRGKNLQKGKKLFNKHAAHFYLNIASANYRKFLELFRKLERTKARKNICKLLLDIKFADESVVQEIEKNDIDDLWDRPLLIGGSSHIDSISFVNEIGKVIQLRTCREYKNAIELGYEPSSNSDNKLSDPFKYLSRLLTTFSTAMPPVQSFISNPYVGIVDLYLLPAEIFTELTALHERADRVQELSGKTVQDLVTSGELKITSTTQNSLSLENDGMGQYLFEVARGDFDDDGLEDILLHVYSYATGGSFGLGNTHVLTRKDKTGLFLLQD